MFMTGIVMPAPIEVTTAALMSTLSSHVEKENMRCLKYERLGLRAAAYQDTHNKVFHSCFVFGLQQKRVLSRFARWRWWIRGRNWRLGDGMLAARRKLFLGHLFNSQITEVLLGFMQSV